MSKKFTLQFTCVGLSDEDVEHLGEMVSKGRGITFATFAKHVDWQDMARGMGYAVGPHNKDLRLKDDWAVVFYRSTWKDQPCYYMQHSAIEHIFLKN